MRSYFINSPQNSKLLLRSSYLELLIEFLITKNDSETLLIKNKIGFGMGSLYYFWARLSVYKWIQGFSEKIDINRKIK